MDAPTPGQRPEEPWSPAARTEEGSSPPRSSAGVYISLPKSPQIPHTAAGRTQLHPISLPGHCPPPCPGQGCDRPSSKSARHAKGSALLALGLETHPEWLWVRRGQDLRGRVAHGEPCSLLCASGPHQPASPGTHAWAPGRRQVVFISVAGVPWPVPAPGSCVQGPAPSPSPTQGFSIPPGAQKPQ